MSLSLKDRAFKYLKSRKGQWINGGELERKALDAGYKGSTISRELRHLAENAEIQRRLKPGLGIKSVEYRYSDERAQTQKLAQEANAEGIEYFNNYKCQCPECKDCLCPAQNGHHELCPHKHVAQTGT